MKSRPSARCSKTDGTSGELKLGTRNSLALARSLFRKGASLTAAMAFEIASTNLVIELGIIMWLLMGWQFTLAEFVGGPVMIVAVALMFRLWMRGRLVTAAREQADRGIAGSMEGHAAMDMSVQGEGSFYRRLFSAPGFTSVSQYYVMDWASVLRDIVIGLLIAGAFAAWVPANWLEAFFLTDDPTVAQFWGPIIGPPGRGRQLRGRGVVHLRRPHRRADHPDLPQVLRNEGRAADHRHLLCRQGARRLRRRTSLQPPGPGARQPSAKVVEASFQWNYTTWLNIAFLVLTVALMLRFVRAGGIGMLRAMGGAPTDGDHEAHGHHQP